MAVPKRRHSKSRKRKRRSHQALENPDFGECDNCGQKKAPHAVCGNCGFYKGKKVVEVDEKGRISTKS